MPGSRRDFLWAACGATMAAPLANTSTALAAIQDERSPSDPPRVLSPTNADLGTLHPLIEQLAAANRYETAFQPGKFATFAEYREAAHRRLLEILAFRPAPVEPRAEVVERRDCGDFLLERLTFSTTPFWRVPAYVLIPKNLRGRAPAIVDLHSHGGMFLFGKEKVIDLGNNHPVMTTYHQRNYDGRPTATALVRRGYVVITIDALMFGERRVQIDGDLKYGWDRSRYTVDDVTHLNQLCRSKESTLVKSLVLAGTTWPGIVAWDDMRTIDYLTTRDEVDPSRIGCVGISMGGYRSLYLTALDARIKAGCVVGFLSSVKPMVKAHIDTHSWVHFLPGLHQHFDLPDVAALAAPRGLLVQQCSQDRLFPLPGMREAVERIGEVYRQAGCAEQFSGRFYDAPHMFTRAMQDEAFAWFDERLKPER